MSSAGQWKRLEGNPEVHDEPHDATACGLLGLTLTLTLTKRCFRGHGSVMSESIMNVIKMMKQKSKQFQHEAQQPGTMSPLTLRGSLMLSCALHSLCLVFYHFKHAFTFSIIPLLLST